MDRKMDRKDFEDLGIEIWMRLLKKAELQDEYREESMRDKDMKFV